MTQGPCTCADHGTFRTTDQDCPVHGIAEMERRTRTAGFGYPCNCPDRCPRHGSDAARADFDYGRRLYLRASPEGRKRMESMLSILEGRSHG